MIKKLEKVTVSEKIGGVHANSRVDEIQYVVHSSRRLPNNEKIIEKINEIIDYLNKEGIE